VLKKAIKTVNGGISMKSLVIFKTRIAFKTIALKKSLRALALIPALFSVATYGMEDLSALDMLALAATGKAPLEQNQAEESEYESENDAPEPQEHVAPEYEAPEAEYEAGDLELLRGRDFPCPKKNCAYSARREGDLARHTIHVNKQQFLKDLRRHAPKNMGIAKKNQKRKLEIKGAAMPVQAIPGYYPCRKTAPDNKPCAYVGTTKEDFLRHKVCNSRDVWTKKRVAHKRQKEDQDWAPGETDAVQEQADPVSQAAVQQPAMPALVQLAMSLQAQQHAMPAPVIQNNFWGSVPAGYAPHPFYPPIAPANPNHPAYLHYAYDPNYPAHPVAYAQPYAIQAQPLFLPHPPAPPALQLSPAERIALMRQTTPAVVQSATAPKRGVPTQSLVEFLALRRQAIDAVPHEHSENSHPALVANAQSHAQNFENQNQ
jgi:hypothetical protein